jgi:hypothetical protein
MYRRYRAVGTVQHKTATGGGTRGTAPLCRALTMFAPFTCSLTSHHRLDPPAPSTAAPPESSKAVAQLEINSKHVSSVCSSRFAAWFPPCAAACHLACLLGLLNARPI